MKIVKKIAAIMLASVMILSAASCGGHPSIVKYNGKEVPVGAYTYYLYNAYQMHSYFGKIDASKTLDKQEIEDTDESGETKKVQADKFLNDYALDQLLYLCELQKRFEEAGLKIDDKELEEAKEAVAEEYAAGKDFYEKNGVAESSLLLASSSGKYGIMQNMLFDYTYGKGGPKEVTDEALNSYYTENYISYTYIYKHGIDDDGEPLPEEEKTKIKNELEEIKAKIEAGETDLEKVANEYKDAYAEDYGCGRNGVPMTTTKITDNDTMKEVLKLKDGEMKVVEIDKYIFLIKRHSITGNGYFDENKESLLDDMKYGEFQSEIRAAAKKADYELNESAFKKFGIRKLKIDGATL